MAKANLPPGVTGGTTTAPKRTIWEPEAGDKLVGKLDKIEGTQFSDMAFFPAAFTFAANWDCLSGPALVKVPISTMLEGLITPEMSGLYFVVDYEGLGVAKGKNDPPKLFKSVTTFAKGSAEEKSLRDFLHRTHTSRLNAGAGPAFASDAHAPLDDDTSDLPF